MKPFGRFLILTLLSLFAFLSAPPLSQTQDVPLQVLQKTPFGETNSVEHMEITATFSQPMVPLSSNDQMATLCPISINPPVEGRCRWRGTNTLVFEPAQPFLPDHHYTVTIPSGTASKVSGVALDKDVTWEFNTLRPQIQYSWPEDNAHWVALDSHPLVRFTLDISLAEILPYIELQEFDLDSTENPVILPFSLRAPTADELKKTWGATAANMAVIVPESPLKKDHAYEIHFKKGLPSKGGEVGLPSDRRIRFETWYTFKLKEKSPDIDCLWHEDLYPRFSLSNSVSVSQFGENMTVTPAVQLNLPERGRWFGSEDASQRQVTFDLNEADWAIHRTYTVTLKAGLTDIFGNKLGQDETFSFTTGGYCPSLDMHSGFGVLESYLKHRHPVDVLNIKAIGLSVRTLPLEKAVPFLKAMETRQEDTVMDEDAHMDWTPPNYIEDHRLHSYIDLDKSLGEPASGFVASVLEWDHPVTAMDDITPLGLTFKTAPDAILAWTSFLRTGQPAPETSLQIRDTNNKVLWKGLTDKDGFAELPGWKSLGITSWPEYQSPELFLLAKHKDGDAIISSYQRGGIEPWRFNIYNDSGRESDRTQGFLFTERGVYRPGEKVYFKAIFRTLGVDDWNILPDHPWQVQLNDARGQQVLNKAVTAGSGSSFDLSYEIPSEAPTGSWFFSVVDSNDKRISFGQSFRVEDIKPASFEVKTHPLKDSYLAGDAYQSSLEGWYLFGAPMASSEATWQLMLNPASYQPPNCDDYDFSPGWWNREVNPSFVAASGSVTLDDKGQALLSSQLDASKMNGPYSADLEASIMSPDRQRIFGRSSVIVHRANLYLGLKSMGYFCEKGKTWRADMISTRPDGTKVGNIQVHAKITRRQWMSVQKAGLGGRLEWVSEQKDSVAKEFDVTTTAGPYPLSFTPSETGDYFLSVSAKDEKGRPAETTVEFYVGGEGEAYWEQKDDDIIELLPDKKSYKPGDTAKILVKSPYQHSKVMVTVERETVLSHWITEINGGADFIQVPLTEKCLPNVYVGVMLVQGRQEKAKYDSKGEDLSKPQAKFGYIQLAVDPKGRRLKVDLATDKSDYRPGQAVTVDVKTSNEEGEPVASECTIFVVDEGLLTLTGYQTPDIFKAFYGPRPLRLGTVDSRMFVIGQRNFGEKGEPSGGGGGKGGALGGVDLRTKFVPTAYWNPKLLTGPNGKARITFKLPDNLSRFRVMTVAQAGKRFGSSDTRFKVNKLLLLRPSLPRFSRLRDHFQGGVVVHNNSSKAMSVTIRMDSHTGTLQVDGSPATQVTVPPGATQEVLWNIIAVQLGTAKLQFRAADTITNENDGLEWSLPVEQPEHLETVATSAATTDEAIEGLQLPPYASKEPGELKVTLSSSALCGLKQGAQFLLDYPYGCLEQKLSKSFPVITGADLLDTFGLGSADKLKPAVQDVLTHLADYQTGDGGFCYWTPVSEPPDPWLTAYALEVSAYAKKEGYEVPEDVIAKARNFLNRYLGSQQKWAYPYSESEDYASRCYTLYALSLWGDQPANYFNNLYERRDQIPFLAKAYLLKASTRLLKDPQVTSTLAQELLNQAKVAPTSMHFEEPTETRMPWIHCSTVVTTARCLQALLETQGGFPGDEKVIAWLTEERKMKGRWTTTLDNALALQVYQDYYRHYEKDTPDFTAKVDLMTGGAYQNAWTDLFKGRSLEAKVESFPLTQVFTEGPDNKIRFTKDGDGRLYYTMRMDYLPVSYDSPVSEGFEVIKTVSPMSGGTLESLKAGARAEVTLTIKTSQDRLFVAISDPLPGGFEIVDPTFATEGKQEIAVGEGEDLGTVRRHRRGLSVNPDNDWGAEWGSFNHHENYDDRILIFSDFLSAGEHTYSYLVQATTPGKFIIPSTWAEQMYEPEVFGRTATSGVTIQK